MTAVLIPELDVTDLSHSLAFYVGVLGFQIRYERPEERFAFLERGGAELMLEEAAGPGRRFRTAPLEPPFGRGVNFQIAALDVETLHRNAAASGAAIVIPLETRWYRVGERMAGNQQFVVADPDGYLLRFFRDLGDRALNNETETPR